MATADRDAYLSAEPVQDERPVALFDHALAYRRLHAGGYTPGAARRAVYPANGRTLTDDVVYVFLSMLTNGKATEDKVGPHADLLDKSPSVGTPHSATLTGAGPAM